MKPAALPLLRGQTQAFTPDPLHAMHRRRGYLAANLRFDAPLVTGGDRYAPASRAPPCPAWLARTL